jgi:hypothetical protein
MCSDGFFYVCSECDRVFGCRGFAEAPGLNFCDECRHKSMENWKKYQNRKRLKCPIPAMESSPARKRLCKNC